MDEEKTKEPPKIGTYEYAISQGATEEQAREYVAREAERAARRGSGEDDDTGDNGDDEEDAREPQPAAPQYFIHSTVRARHTRLKRMKAPVHAALLQHIGGLRVRRKRPVPVTMEKLGEIIHDLRKAHADGRLELRTADGRIVDLYTGEPQGPAPVPRPVAGAPLDSAAMDKPAGIPLPVYQEGAPLGVPGKRPAVIPDDEEDEDDWDDTTSSVPPPPGVPAAPPQTDDPPAPSLPPAAAEGGERREEDVETNPSGLPPPPGVPNIPQPGEGLGEGGDAETTPEETLAADGETTEASGDTEAASDETNEDSGETESEEQPPESVPGKVPLPQVARRGGKKRGR